MYKYKSHLHHKYTSTSNNYKLIPHKIDVSNFEYYELMNMIIIAIVLILMHMCIKKLCIRRKINSYKNNFSLI